MLFILSAAASLWYGGSEKLNGPDQRVLDFIFYEIRVPKTVTALLAGSSLAVAGLILQVIFRNPLAGPYVLGISSGAALFVAAGMLAGNVFGFADEYSGGRTWVLIYSITGSLLVTVLILAVSARVRSNVVLLLIGLMFSQICGALQTALEYFAEPANLKTFVVWGMGSLSNTTASDLLVFGPTAVLALAAVMFFIKPLNAMLLGQDYAINSGINFLRSRFILILIASVLTGVTTAFCGPVAFIGIAVPILSRMVFDSAGQMLHIFSCVLIGSILLFLADALCASLMKNVTLPVNMITTFIGAPVVIYLMFRNKQW